MARDYPEMRRHSSRLSQLHDEDEDSLSAEASGVHLASDDYPEMGSILLDRPDPGLKITVVGYRRQAADSYGGDEDPRDGDYNGGENDSGTYWAEPGQQQWMHEHSPQEEAPPPPWAPSVMGAEMEGEMPPALARLAQLEEARHFFGMARHEVVPPGTLARRHATTINGTQVDGHGDAPEHGTVPRASEPNAYDARSTEGDGDPAWSGDADPDKHDKNSATVGMYPEGMSAGGGPGLEVGAFVASDRHTAGRVPWTGAERGTLHSWQDVPTGTWGDFVPSGEFLGRGTHQSPEAQAEREEARAEELRAEGATRWPEWPGADWHTTRPERQGAPEDVSEEFKPEEWTEEATPGEHYFGDHRRLDHTLSKRWDKFDPDNPAYQQILDHARHDPDVAALGELDPEEYEGLATGYEHQRHERGTGLGDGNWFDHTLSHRVEAAADPAEEAYWRDHLQRAHGWTEDNVTRSEQRGQRFSHMHDTLHSAGMANHSHEDPGELLRAHELDERFGQPYQAPVRGYSHPARGGRTVEDAADAIAHAIPINVQKSFDKMPLSKWSAIDPPHEHDGDDESLDAGPGEGDDGFPEMHDDLESPDDWPLAQTGAPTGPAYTQGRHDGHGGRVFPPPPPPPMPAGQGMPGEDPSGAAGDEDGAAGDGEAGSGKKIEIKIGAHLDAFVAAASSSEFRFHFTAAWSDVVAKAKRLRKEGYVRITHASRGLVVGEVRGDHDTYESGIQRPPGKPQTIQHWACGCPWASFHQDRSLGTRYAGRPCSHVMALQFEAQARGMFGKSPAADESRPSWYKDEVTVKSWPPYEGEPHGGHWNQYWLAPSASLRAEAAGGAPYMEEPGDSEIAAHMMRQHGMPETSWMARSDFPPEELRSFHRAEHKYRVPHVHNHQHEEPSVAPEDRRWPPVFQPEQGFEVDQYGGIPRSPYAEDPDEPSTLGEFRPMPPHWSSLRAEAGMPSPNYDPSEELPQGRGIWYRAHNVNHPLHENYARSRELNGYGSYAGQRGYSAFASPHHLSQYMDEYGWIGEDSDPVNWYARKAIAFHGQHVGRGADGEALVIPKAAPECCGRVIHSQMPWEDFERKIWDENPPESIPAKPWDPREATDPVQKSIRRNQRQACSEDGRGQDCHYHHPGDCPAEPMDHTAESLRHSRPGDFWSEIRPNPKFDPDSDSPYETGSHVLYGFLGQRPAGTLHFSQSDDGQAHEVHMLHTRARPEFRSKGIASAMMDDLYSHVKQNGRWIDHGIRTTHGNNWWAGYREPYPELNTHHAHPDEGWKDYWSPPRVAMDAAGNFTNSEGRGVHSPLRYRADDYEHDDRDDQWTGARGLDPDEVAQERAAQDEGWGEVRKVPWSKGGWGKAGGLQVPAHRAMAALLAEGEDPGELAALATLVRTADVTPEEQRTASHLNMAHGVKVYDMEPGHMNEFHERLHATRYPMSWPHQHNQDGSARQAALILTADQANAPWGSNNVSAHPPVKPYGATAPPNKDQDPGSYGPLAGPDPENWGGIQEDSIMQMPLSNTAALEDLGFQEDQESFPYPDQSGTAGPSTSISPGDPNGIRMDGARRQAELGRDLPWAHDSYPEAMDHAASEARRTGQNAYVVDASHGYGRNAWIATHEPLSAPLHEFTPEGAHNWIPSTGHAAPAEPRDPWDTVTQTSAPEQAHNAPTSEEIGRHGLTYHPLFGWVTESMLHDEPEPALPSTTGDDQEEGEDLRERDGIDGTMGDAQDVPHEFAASRLHGGCAVCGLNHGVTAAYRVEDTQPADHPGCTGARTVWLTDGSEPRCSGCGHRVTNPATGQVPQQTRSMGPGQWVKELPSRELAKRASEMGDLNRESSPQGQYPSAATSDPELMGSGDELMTPSDQSIQTIGNQQWSGGGADSDEVDVPAGQPGGSLDDIVAAFQRSAAARQFNGGASGGGPQADGDIAAAARQFLSKTADVLPHAEAEELIREGAGQRARNLSLLRLEGTHYEDDDPQLLDEYDDDVLSL